MPPVWLTIVAWVSLGSSILSALIVLADISRGHSQKMAVMNWVWPLTPLYLGVPGLWAYFAFGRSTSRSDEPMAMPDDPHSRDNKPKTPLTFPIVFKGTTHCGAGCTLGDIVTETMVFWTGVTLFSGASGVLWTEYLANFAVAYIIGIVFQYFAIAPMRHLGIKDGIIAAVKADTLSIAAFQIGMYAMMAVTYFILFPAPHHLHPNSAAYWFLMQIAMAIGFATNYPMNAYLIRSGLKEAM
jgi:hypothetical protein